MKRIVFVVTVAIMLALFAIGRQPSHAQAPALVKASPVKPPQVKTMVEKSVALLQTLGSSFIEQTGCVSCHNNSLPAVAVAVARAHGIKVNEQAIATENRQVLAVWEARRDQVLQGDSFPGANDTASYILLGLAAGRQTPTPTTDAIVNYLMGLQDSSGKWTIGIKSRPPLESSDFNATALSMRAIQLYAPSGRREEVNQRVAEARQWLLNNAARTNEDRVFQLLGLHWSGAPAAPMRKLAEQLRATQHTDGGWSQLPGMASDAFATGQADVGTVFGNRGFPAAKLKK
jgi:hypothetical protein